MTESRQRPRGRTRKSDPSGKRAGADGATNPRTAVVLRQIRELFRVSQEHFKRIEARCGVSGVQVWAAAELRARPGMTISELAHALSVHLSTASNLLDRMETNGLVRRERSRRDQRVVRVYVTASGSRILRKAPKPVQGVIPDALERMPAAGLSRLHRDLGRLLALARIRDRGAAMRPLAEP
jgi:DNA-binding MarR family transcriptional regulator